MPSSAPALRRNLSARQLQLIALGSTIGVGLFLGSATAIELAGPSILLAYAASGVVTFIVLRALGEIAVYHPVSGSFAVYATTYAHPIVGFLVGWGYWAYWTIIAVAEVTAVGIYMQFWFPGSPQWQWALAAIVAMGGFNLLAARVFGELEFWFALIKIATILALIALGTVVIVWGFPGDWKPLGLGNLVNHGGFFPNGLTGCLLAMQMVLYAYVGAEMIGLTAGEAENPEKTLPRAINSFVWRIALFYVGAILVILAIFPWNRIAANGSPFVEVFERLGLAGAAGVVNFVVITAALSSCNGGIYASGRMLFSLASSREAPRRLGQVSPTGVPRTAILFTVLIGMLGVAINYWAPQHAFEYLTSAVTFVGILIWLSILFTHARFRQRLGADEVKQLQFRMGLWPWSSLLAAAFLAGVVVILLAGDETRLSSLIGLLLLAIIAPCYALTRRSAAREDAPGYLKDVIAVKHRKNHGVALLFATTALSSLFWLNSQAFGQDANWRLLPRSFDFNTGTNWSTGTVPTGTATFGASNRTLLLFSASTSLNEINFGVNAPTYLFWIRGQDLTLSGAGIRNASSSAQVFLNDGSLNLVGSSTAANASIVNISGGRTVFLNSSAAGGATIANIEGGSTTFNSASTAGSSIIANYTGGYTEFHGTSTAGAAEITTYNEGYMLFTESSTAGSATVTTNKGGNTVFAGFSTAGNAAATTNDGGSTFFAESSTAGSATVTTNSGGSIFFSNSSTAGSATVTTSGTGLFDISPLSSGGLTAGSIAGDGRYLLGSKSLTVGSNNQSTTVSGSIEDGGLVGGTGGSLVKTGTGTLVLSGVNSYTGRTTVNGGTLSVDGSTASSVLTVVNAGGTLGGTGTVGTTQIKRGGTLSPGNSIGSITVNGNLAFGAGSTYAVEVSPGAADLTSVSGTASLAGKLQSVFAPGPYYARTYTLLSATDGRTGTFGTFTTAGLPGGFRTNLSYTPNDVMLNLTAALGSGAVLSSNQGNVANALNTSFNSGNSLSSGLYGLFSMSGPPLANALNSLSGEVQTGAQTAAFTFGNQFLNTVLGSTGSDGPGGNWQQAVQYASLDTNEAGPEPRRLRAWLAGFGGYGWLDGASGSSSVQTTTQGLAMGADWTFDGGTLGVAVASGSSNWFLAGGLGNGLGNVLQVGLYGRTGSGPMYAAVAGGWGVHGVSASRSVGFLGDFMSGNYTVNTWSGRAEAGYRIALGDHGLTPFVAGQVQAANLPGFCETSRTGSGAALCFSSNTATSLRSELGIEVDANLGTVLGSKARLQSRLAWAHEYETTGTATAWFQSLPGSGFSVSGTPLPANVGLVRVLSDFELDRTWSLRLQGDAEFAGNYGLLAGTARIVARW